MNLRMQKKKFKKENYITIMVPIVHRRRLKLKKKTVYVVDLFTRINRHGSGYETVYWKEQVRRLLKDLEDQKKFVKEPPENKFLT